MSDFDHFLRELKEVVDRRITRGYEAHGPLRVSRTTSVDNKGKVRCGIRIDSGWDFNYGGHVYIEASPTGKSLTVFVSPHIKVKTQPR